MKKIYLNPLFRLVESKMAERLPEFMPYKLADKSAKKSARSFCWNVNGKTRIFLEIWVHPSGYDKFYCNFGWSKINEYPSVMNDPLKYSFPFLDPTRAFNDAEAFGGIQRLWGDNSTGEWQIPTPLSTYRILDFKDDIKAGALEQMRLMKLEESMTESDGERLVIPIVDELFEKLEIQVMPYLRQYVEYVSKN